MIKIIGSVFRYSLLVLVILVLSHVVEIKGVSISQHVLNGMQFLTAFTPTRMAQKISSDYSQALRQRLKALENKDGPVDSD
jgi:hypothetical protein